MLDDGGEVNYLISKSIIVHFYFLFVIILHFLFVIVLVFSALISENMHKRREFFILFMLEKQRMTTLTFCFTRLTLTLETMSGFLTSH